METCHGAIQRKCTLTLFASIFLQIDSMSVLKKCVNRRAKINTLECLQSVQIGRQTINSDASAKNTPFFTVCAPTTGEKSCKSVCNGQRLASFERQPRNVYTRRFMNGGGKWLLMRRARNEKREMKIGAHAGAINFTRKKRGRRR